MVRGSVSALRAATVVLLAGTFAALILLSPTAFAQSPVAAPAASGVGTELLSTFPVSWMRGLVVVDDANGAKAITANAEIAAGTIFTKIDQQPVANAADLIAKVQAADPKNISITSQDPPAAPLGVACTGYPTRAQATGHNNQRISYDARGKWRQITGIDINL